MIMAIEAGMGGEARSSLAYLGVTARHRSDASRSREILRKVSDKTSRANVLNNVGKSYARRFNFSQFTR